MTDGSPLRRDGTAEGLLLLPCGPDCDRTHMAVPKCLCSYCYCRGFASASPATIRARLLHTQGTNHAPNAPLTRKLWGMKAKLVFFFAALIILAMYDRAHAWDGLIDRAAVPLHVPVHAASFGSDSIEHHDTRD